MEISRRIPELYIFLVPESFLLSAKSPKLLFHPFRITSDPGPENRSFAVEPFFVAPKKDQLEISILKFSSGFSAGSIISDPGSSCRGG